MDTNPTERNKIDHLLPKNEDDALCQRIKPVLGPAFVAVTAPKGRASVISGSLFSSGLRTQDSGLRTQDSGAGDCMSPACTTLSRECSSRLKRAIHGHVAAWSVRLRMRASFTMVYAHANFSRISAVPALGSVVRTTNVGMYFFLALGSESPARLNGRFGSRLGAVSGFW